MVLVDTSVLIGYFKEFDGPPFDKMDFIIDNEIPYGICNYVYQELLQGSGNKQEFENLKEYLDTLPFYDLRYGKQSFENTALMFFSCRKKGMTVRNSIDLIIAEIAIENNLNLLHNDSDYTNISKVYQNLKIY
jgi:predicted nucleic acid-binding protein